MSEPAGQRPVVEPEFGVVTPPPEAISAGHVRYDGPVAALGRITPSPQAVTPSEDHEVLPDWLKNRRTLILLRRQDARGAIARKWLKARGRTGCAVTYAYEIERFFAWCDTRRLNVLSLDREHIDDYRQELLRELQEPTVAKKLSALSSFYKFGMKAKGQPVKANPVADVDRPRVSRKSRTAGLDEGEVGKLLRAAQAENARDRAIVFVLYATGVRISELRGAKASRLRTLSDHLQMEVLRKGGERDWVTMRPEAAEALQAYLDGRETGPLFVGVRGGTVSRREVASLLARLCKSAGIGGKNITPHSMRHTYATMSLNGGASLRDVQEAMGHSSPVTTMRYDRARLTVERAPTHVLAWSS